jgi:hypothetical protein
MLLQNRQRIQKSPRNQRKNSPRTSIRNLSKRSKTSRKSSRNSFIKGGLLEGKIGELGFKRQSLRLEKRIGKIGELVGIGGGLVN